MTYIWLGLSNASCSLDEIFEARDAAKTRGQHVDLWFQLYVNRDSKITEARVKKAADGGCTAIVLTVDSPQGGNRTRDLRAKTREGLDIGKPIMGAAEFAHLRSSCELEFAKGVPDEDVRGSLTWDDLAWIKSIAPNTKLVLSESRTFVLLRLLIRGCRGHR